MNWRFIIAVVLLILFIDKVVMGITADILVQSFLIKEEDRLTLEIILALLFGMIASYPAYLIYKGKHRWARRLKSILRI